MLQYTAIVAFSRLIAQDLGYTHKHRADHALCSLYMRNNQCSMRHEVRSVLCLPRAFLVWRKLLPGLAWANFYCARDFHHVFNLVSNRNIASSIIHKIT